jgi:DNA-binding transcriptional regulator YdaS (Cro superfamily)
VGKLAAIMKKLHSYLNNLDPADQANFAQRCGTSVGYLRKAISKGQRIGEALCINLERESAGVIPCEDTRPDVDWAYLRGTAPAPLVSSPA